MSDDETVTVVLELTEQQYRDTLSAINSKEVDLTESDRRDRALELTHVWADIYRAGDEAFGGVGE